MMKVMLKQLAVVRREIRDDIHALKGEVEGMSSGPKQGAIPQSAASAAHGTGLIRVAEEAPAAPAPAAGRRRVRKVRVKQSEESAESHSKTPSPV